MPEIGNRASEAKQTLHEDVIFLKELNSNKMIRFSTAVVPFRWKSSNNFSLKLISHSQLSQQKQFLSKDLTFAKYSDDRSDLVKHDEVIVLNNKLKKIEDLHDKSHNKRKNTSTTNKDGDEKSSLLKCIESYNIENGEAGKGVNQENNESMPAENHADKIIDFLRRCKIEEVEDEIEKVNDLDESSYSHHDQFHEKPVLDFLKELKSCDVSDVSEELESRENNSAVNFVRFPRNSSKAISDKNLKCIVEDFETKLDAATVELILEVILSQKLHLCPNTTVWLASVITSSLSHWTDVQKLKLMASEEFIMFVNTLLMIIPQLNSNDIMHRIYYFSKKLPTCFNDILYYQIFTVFENRVNQMNEMNAGTMLELLRVLHNERHIDMVDNLIHILDEKLANLNKKNRRCFFTLPLKHILIWAHRGHIDNECRIKILLFLAVLPNRTWIHHNVSHIYRKLLYEINNINSATIDFEEKYYKKVEILSYCIGSASEVCDFIYHHGKTVQKGQAKFQINLVHILVNNIVEQNNLSFKSVGKLVSGLQKLDYYNYKFGRFLANYFINNSESIEKNIWQYNKFLSMLLNYDISFLLKKDWPYFKFFLENSFFLSNKSYWYRNEQNWTNLLNLAKTLSCIKIFPDKLLKFLSEKSNDRRTLDLPIKYLLRILQLNRAVRLFHSELQFLSREMTVLIRERLDHLNQEGDGYNYSMTIVEKIKKSLEIKIELDGFTLIDCYTSSDQRIPLLMAFDAENKPRSLQNFKETKNHLQLENLRAQENIKFVAVLLFSDNAFLTSSQGVSYLKASHMQNVQFLECEGYHVQYFKYDDISCRPNDEIGPYIYEVVKNKLNSSKQT